MIVYLKPTDTYWNIKVWNVILYINILLTLYILKCTPL